MTLCYKIINALYSALERDMPELDKRELAAVLAGLRALQDLRDMTAGELPQEIADIFTNGASHPRLTIDEIDQLCERLNVE